MNEVLNLLRGLGDAAENLPAFPIVFRVTLLLLAAMLVLLALRRISAALRHMVWTLALASTLLVPLCYCGLPSWHWAILPPPREQTTPGQVAEMPRPAPHLDEPRSTPHQSLGFDPSDKVRPNDFSQVRELRGLEPLPAPSPAAAPALAPAIAPPAVSDSPAPPASPQPAPPWSTWLAAAWALGTFLGLVWLGVGVVAAWHVARSARPAEPQWQVALQRLLDRYGVRSPIAVRESAPLSVPMTWGLLRPVILVPDGSSAWSEEIKRSVLLHELAHVRRGDCLVLLLGRLACAAYWFHPLVWLAARQLRKTCEQAADDMVLSSEIAPHDYAEHLVSIAARMRRLHWFGHLALPMAGPSDLESRVVAILDPRRNRRSLKRATCCGLTLVATSLVVLCAILRLGYAQKSSEPDANGAASEQTAEAKPTADRATTDRPAEKAAHSGSSASLDEVVRKVRENEALLRNIAYTVRIAHKYAAFDGENMAHGVPTAVIPTGSWPATDEEILRTVSQENRLSCISEELTTLQSGEKTHAKRIWVCDGTRTVAIEDGNSAAVYTGRCEPGQFLPPHCWGIFPLIVNFPLSVYLQGTDAIQAYRKAPRGSMEMNDSFDFNKVESQVLGEEKLDGLDCIKVRVKRWYDTSSPPALLDLWLAKDRNYHVVQCRRSSSHDGKEVGWDLTRVTKWREAAKGVWLPETVEWQNLDATQKDREKETLRLVVDKVALNPDLPTTTFALPEIPAALPKFVVGQDGRLIEAPHLPTPAKAEPGTSLATILKRLADEESRYARLEIAATTRYAQLNDFPGNRTTRERSVVAGDRMFHEEESGADDAAGPGYKSSARQAYDGQWTRAYSESSGPDQKPQAYAGLDFGGTSFIQVIRPHTIFFHDGTVYGKLLSARPQCGLSRVGSEGTRVP